MFRDEPRPVLGFGLAVFVPIILTIIDRVTNPLHNEIWILKKIDHLALIIIPIGIGVMVLFFTLKHLKAFSEKLLKSVALKVNKFFMFAFRPIVKVVMEETILASWEDYSLQLAGFIKKDSEKFITISGEKNMNRPDLDQNRTESLENILIMSS